MSVYNSENLKWDAYQFSDPFATNAFVCLNTLSRTVCRPNCDFLPKVDSKQHIKFFENIESINSTDPYSFCNQCDPSSPKTALNLQLIKLTIDAINNSIGFTKDSNDLKRRAYSVPSLNTNDGHFTAGDRQLSRNESEHFKLVELACRHIAAAAVDNLTKQSGSGSSSSSVSSASSGGSTEDKKKRRGGVLGFKELASKSKLSAWHFHRVFKSVTGLTPKSYGDRCWDYLKNRDRPQTSRQQQRSIQSHFKPTSSELYSSKQSSTSRRRSAAKLEAQDDHEGSISPSDTSSLLNPKPKKKRKVSLNESPLGLTSSSNSTSSNSSTSNTTERFQFSNDLFHPSNPNTLLDLNKNSLDINDTPFRHHSLDLNAVNFDLTDFNSKLFAQLSPQFMPFDVQPQQPPYQHMHNHNYQQLPNRQQHIPLSHQTQPQSQVQPQLQQNRSQFVQNGVPTPGALFDQSGTTLPLTAPSSTVLHQPVPLTSSNQASTLSSHSTSVSQIDENQWPTLQASTPPDQVIEMKSSPGSNPNTDPEMSFYDALNNSPLDNVTIGSTNDNISEDGYFVDLIPSSSASNTKNFDFSSDFAWTNNNTVGVDQALFVGSVSDEADTDDFLRGLSSDFKMSSHNFDNLTMNI